MSLRKGSKQKDEHIHNIEHSLDTHHKFNIKLLTYKFPPLVTHCYENSLRGNFDLFFIMMIFMIFNVIHKKDNFKFTLK